MNSEDIVKLDKDYIINSYGSRDLVFQRGEGAYLFDNENQRYLDFVSGISVCNLGHCHPKITKVIQEQAGQLLHISNLYLNTITPFLAEKLVKISGLSKVFFANSGAEANEGLIKLARKWGNQFGKNEIITMENSFHGRTLATLSATGREKYKQGFEPHMEGFKTVPYNNLSLLEKAITEKTVAVFLEPILGEGGVIPADKEYLQGVRKLCDKHNIMMILDEVQTGIGRTGKMFAYQNYGIKPDAVSLAKAIANGLPMGAFLLDEKFGNVLTAGTHASTFGGTAIVSSAAKKVLEIFEEDKILLNVNKQSSYLSEKLNELKNKYDFITDIRVVGLFVGIDVGKLKDKIIERVREKHMLILGAGEETIRLLPPLIITQIECDKAIAILTEVFEEVA